jgi:hypothetical protein
LTCFGQPIEQALRVGSIGQRQALVNRSNRGRRNFDRKDRSTEKDSHCGYVSLQTLLKNLGKKEREEHFMLERDTSRALAGYEKSELRHAFDNDALNSL